MATILVTCNSCLNLEAHFLSILKYGASWNVTKFPVAIGYVEKVSHKENK